MRRHLPENRNFMALKDADCAPETAGAIILTAPFEKTSSFGTGSAAGPDAVIEASHEVELFDAVIGFETFRQFNGIATIEPIECDDGELLCDELDRETTRWLERNRMVVTIGGEHTSIVGAVRAHCRRHKDLTVLQLDAHSDLRQDYQGNPWSHACAMQRILDFHPSIVQVGIRSEALEERVLAESLKIPVFYADRIQIDEAENRDWIGSIIAQCRSNVYITFDCDAFDPSVIPATGTPEPGGLSWYQVDRLMKRLSQDRQIAGFDVSELAPIEGLQHPQFTIAKLIYRLLGYCVKNR